MNTNIHIFLTNLIHYYNMDIICIDKIVGRIIIKIVITNNNHKIVKLKRVKLYTNNL